MRALACLSTLACLLGAAVAASAQERVAPPRPVDAACAADCVDRGYEAEPCARHCMVADDSSERRLPPANWHCVQVCRNAGGEIRDCIRRCPRSGG